ncbi:MAG: Asp-tRNA(Asn)/Glu-tRNA(Gln) amidotransferase subunit GatA [Patescibacteria group bacterium]
MPTIFDLHQQLKSKKITSVELTKKHLEVIKKKDSDLNAFVSCNEDKALAKAEYADSIIKKGEADYLTGIPFAAKDVFCVKDYVTTAGSKILEIYEPPYSATAIKKLDESPLLGKTNMDEFAMGVSGENSAYGPTKNPHNNKHVTGGSSSGSAAAVASGEAVFALGSDTSGSVRQPASFCGCVGFKPTYGRISRYGLIALASSIDTVGFFTQDIRDSAILLEALAGQDDLDSTTPPKKVDNYLAQLEEGVKGMIIGVPKEYFEVEGIDEEIKKQVLEKIELYKKLGAKIKNISLPHTKDAIATYYIIMDSEASSNLSRYDGVKYGFRSDEKTLEATYKETRAKGFGDEPKRRIMMGTFSLSAGYQDKYYHQALKVRTLIKKDFEDAFKEVDVIASPTTPNIAFKIGEIKDVLQLYLQDIFTASSSLAGICALSMPIGKIDGLPVGLQLMGPQFGENQILKAGYALEHCVL